MISNGFRMGAAEAVRLLQDIGFEVKPTDDKVLMKIARTAMTGKSVGGERDRLADIAVRAVRQVSEKTDGASIHGRNDPWISAAPRSTATR